MIIIIVNKFVIMTPSNLYFVYRSHSNDLDLKVVRVNFRWIDCIPFAPCLIAFLNHNYKSSLLLFLISLVNFLFYGVLPMLVISIIIANLRFFIEDAEVISDGYQILTAVPENNKFGATCQALKYID